ncbi:MAG: hypothetical protein E7231_08270 [Cellulosilyticum sp.]|nr:hypothetical protein [Cellulosilyticum sp.]
MIPIKPLQVTEVFHQIHDCSSKTHTQLPVPTSENTSDTPINCTPPSSSSHYIHGQLKITNVSSDYIQNLKLMIDDKEHMLLEQLVSRERGSLTFPPSTVCLELGNLAPNESAYFEYKCNLSSSTTISQSEPLSFTQCLSISYGDDTHSSPPKKQVSELLSDTPDE